MLSTSHCIFLDPPLLLACPALVTLQPRIVLIMTYMVMTDLTRKGVAKLSVHNCVSLNPAPKPNLHHIPNTKYIYFGFPGG